MAGYTVSWEIINMAEYGVPQNRRRIIMIGLRAECLETHLALAKTLTPSIFIQHDKKFQEKRNKKILKEF